VFHVSRVAPDAPDATDPPRCQTLTPMPVLHHSTVAKPWHMQQIGLAMSAAEIIEQIKVLPKKELAHVIEYVHQIEQQAGEMTDADLLSAAKRTGSFTLLEGPGESIYSAEKK